jgi:tetratricopeptide (TPR) repeat protein
MSGHYPNQYPNQYPNPYVPPPAYTPPPRRDNSRITALVIAVLVVGGAGVGIYFAVQKALYNYEVQAQANKVVEVYSKAVKLYEAGRYPEAAAIFQKVRTNPKASIEMIEKAARGEAFCYRILGQRAQDLKDFASAERWFQAAVQVSPEDIGAREELAAVQKAIEVLQNPPTTSPPLPGENRPGTPSASDPPPLSEDDKKAMDAMEHYNRGNVLLREGRRADACREWHEAILRAPGTPGAVQAQAQRAQHCQGFPHFGG